MNDDIDIYLSRYLKNWAAKQQTPVDGHKILLEKAASPPLQRQWRVSRLFSWINTLYTYPAQETLYYRNEWSLDPLTKYRIFSSHLAANLRIA